jgi:hypothetical protein
MATPPKVDLATISLAGRWPGEAQASGRRHVHACVVATARGALPGTPLSECRKPPLWSLHSCRPALRSV